MVMSFVFIMAMLGSLIISLAVYPLVLGGCILLMSLAIVGIITFKFSVFYGLVLLLIFVGGLLVAFGYAVALASNPFFGVSNRVSEKSSIFLVFCSLGFLTLLYFSFYYFEFEVGLDFGAMVNFFQSELSLYVGFEWGVMVVVLGILLFISMVAVVSVCCHYKGALVEFSRGKGGKI